MKRLIIGCLALCATANADIPPETHSNSPSPIETPSPYFTPIYEHHTGGAGGFELSPTLYLAGGILAGLIVTLAVGLPIVSKVRRKA